MTAIAEARAQILNKAAGSPAFRARLLGNPAAAIEEETGMSIPDGFSITAHEDPTSGVQLALSAKAPLTDEELANIVGGGGSGEGDDESWAEQAKAAVDEKLASSE